MCEGPARNGARNTPHPPIIGCDQQLPPHACRVDGAGEIGRIAVLQDVAGKPTAIAAIVMRLLYGTRKLPSHFDGALARLQAMSTTLQLMQQAATSSNAGVTLATMLDMFA
jgi:hypothetical protein